MRLVQFKDSDSSRKVGAILDGASGLILLENTRSTYDLAMEAIRTGLSLENIVVQRLDHNMKLDYGKIISENRLLPPLDHPDPSHCLVSGTGLNHLGSALARNSMHTSDDKSNTTDSMKMFKLGLEGGKPKEGQIGAQPEWFYKGDGNCIISPGSPLELPSFALDGGEEAELVGLYVISKSSEVFRVGFALGNEYSDHVLEKQNYLYLAHSKLRDCSIGPELLIGQIPDHVTGLARLIRGGEIIWSSSFLTGEANMTHTLSNIEHHHFKYARFRQPGDAHCHFFGASVLSFSGTAIVRPGDTFEISSPEFGWPLTNPVKKSETDNSKVVVRLL